MSRLVTRALEVLVVVLMTLPVFPQTTEQQPAPKTAEEAKKPKVAEEMVVTARKREETVQEVPVSVAAPTESQLRDRGAENLEDVAANVAGFIVQNVGPGQSQVAMRGVSAGQIIRDQPGVKEQVGVYLDESVVSLSLFTPDLDLFDLSRVEVLRGPQGTLFGSGSLAGTVRYISNQPTLNQQSNVAELTFGAINEGGVGGSAKYAGNLPIGSIGAARIAAYYTNYGGWTDAVTPSLKVQEDVNDGYRAGGRLAFRFAPNERLSITPRVVYQKSEINGWNRVDDYNILGNPYTTTRPKVQLGDRNIFAQIEEPFTDEFTLGDLNIGYDFGNIALTSITSYSDRDILVVRDATALTASITGGSFGAPPVVYNLNAPLFDATAAKSFTQEVRLSSSRGKLNWVGGVFYSTSERDYNQNLPVIGFEDLCKVNNCGPLSNVPTAGSKIANKDELYKSDLHYDYDQFALFGEGTWAFNPKMELTAGLRYYDFTEDRTQVFDGLFSDPNDSVGSTDASGIAPRFIFTYKATANTRINAQISKGFRLGGLNDPLNLPLCTPADKVIYGGKESWEDETLWDYEVGSKSTIAKGRGSINASVYYMDIDDLQATVTAGSCSSRIIVNVPSARSAGVEAEFELAPADWFDFAISGNLNNSELRSSFTSSTGAIVAGIQEGNRLPTVPEFQGAVAATLRFKPFGRYLPYTSGVFQYIGDRYSQIGDQAAGFGIVNLQSFAPNTIGGPIATQAYTFDPKLPSYTMLNLRFGILQGGWDVAFYVNNALDEEAHLALDQERGTRARVGHLTNQPRTIGLSARVNF